MTVDELAATKTRGTTFGSSANLIKASADRRGATGNAANVARAAKRHVDLEPVIRGIQGDGKTSLNQIAAELNERRIPAARGGKWSAVQVARVLSRIAVLQIGRVSTVPASLFLGRRVCQCGTCALVLARLGEGAQPRLITDSGTLRASVAERGACSRLK